MPSSTPPTGLHWIGDGTRFIPGVPARDLAPEELGAFNVSDLIGSGLYTEAASASAAKQKADSTKEKP